MKSDWTEEIDRHRAGWRRSWVGWLAYGYDGSAETDRHRELREEKEIGPTDGGYGLPLTQ